MTGWNQAGLEDLHHSNYGEPNDPMGWMSEGFGCRRKRAKEEEIFSRGGKRGRNHVRGRGGRGGGAAGLDDGIESWEDKMWEDKMWEDVGRYEEERRAWEEERAWERGSGLPRPERPERHGRIHVDPYGGEEYDHRDRRGGAFREDYEEERLSQHHGLSTSWPPTEEEDQLPRAEKEKRHEMDWMTAEMDWDNMGAIQQSSIGRGADRGRHDVRRGVSSGRGGRGAPGIGRGAGSDRLDKRRIGGTGVGSGSLGRGNQLDDGYHQGKLTGSGRGGRASHDDEYHVPRPHDKPRLLDQRDHGGRDKEMDLARAPVKGRGTKGDQNKSNEKGQSGDQSRKQDHGRSRERDQERNREKDRDGDRRHDRDQDRDRDRDRGKDRSRDRGRDRSRDRDNRRSREGDREKIGEKGRGILKDGDRKKSQSLKGGRKLEWWEEEMPLSLEEKEEMYTCTLCNVRCGGPKPYQQHLNGTTHKLRAQVFPDEDPARHLVEQVQEEEYQEEEEYWEEEEELTLEERMKEFYCKLCEVQTTSQENLNMHNDGMRHKANVERRKKGVEIIKGSRNKGGRSKKKKITVTGEDIIEIQPIIDRCSEPIVGLELIIEYLKQEWQTESNFYCTLCEARFQQNNFMAHVTGYRHRYGYIKIKRPECKDMCRVEPKEKEIVKEVDGKKVKEIVPKRNRTGVLANLTKICYEIQKADGRQKMMKGPDPDPPEMPLNRLKKTMRADSQVQLKSLDPEEFSKPVTFPAPVPIGGVKRPAPKTKPKERIEVRPTIIGYQPPDVPPPGMSEVPSDLPPDAPPPTAMMMRPGARPGMIPPVKARPLPPPPRPPPRRPDQQPQIGLPPKTLKMRELEEEMEREQEIGRNLRQEREQSRYLTEALEREKEQILQDTRRLDMETLRKRDRSLLRERDPFLASYIEKGCPPTPPKAEPSRDRAHMAPRERDPFLASYIEKGGPPTPPEVERSRDRAHMLDRPLVSQDLKDLYENKPSTSRSRSDEELKREYEARFGKKESSSSSRVLEEVVGALSKSLTQSDEDASMALKVSSALTEALLSMKKKEEESRTAVDFPNIESEGPPPPPPGDAEMPPLPSDSPPSTPQQRYILPSIGSKQREAQHAMHQPSQPAQPTFQEAPQQGVVHSFSSTHVSVHREIKVPQPAAPPLGEWQLVNPPQSMPPGYPYTVQQPATPQPQMMPQPAAQGTWVQDSAPGYMPGVRMAVAPHQYMPPYRKIPPASAPTTSAAMLQPGAQMAIAPHQYMPPYSQPAPPQTTVITTPEESLLPPGESNPAMFSF